MLRNSIAGVGVCGLRLGRTEKHHSILAGNAQIRTILFLIEPTYSASFPLRRPSSTSKVLRFAVPSSVLVWRRGTEMDRRDDRDLMTVYEPRSKTHTTHTHSF